VGQRPEFYHQGRHTFLLIQEEVKGLGQGFVEWAVPGVSEERHAGQKSTPGIIPGAAHSTIFQSSY
jgi:hypothetical protein